MHKNLEHCYGEPQSSIWGMKKKYFVCVCVCVCVVVVLFGLVLFGVGAVCLLLMLPIYSRSV